MKMHPLPIKTSDGVFTAWLTAEGLARLNFPGHAAQTQTTPLPAALKPLARLVTAALQRCLSGRAPQTLPPLDLSGGTRFQRAVWQALLSIPVGQTVSYSQIAQTVKAPRATRAVGSACGANPIPVFVPCHRVLPKARGLGGFSGGLDWKRLLLTREGHSI